MRPCALAFAVLVIAGLASGADVRAQGGDAHAEALRHFRIGLELIAEQAWDPALAAFLRSGELYATSNALENAAVCLRELGRFDEALDTYDGLCARFGESMPLAERRSVDDDIARLLRFVGSVDVKSDPPGATVVIDGRLRGTTPFVSPLRASVGTRIVRVTREGFAPYETRALIASGETARIDARLSVVSRLGRVRLLELAGAHDEVLVDGVVVGSTPWAGTLVAGTHTIALRGKGDAGAAPAEIHLATGEDREIVLAGVPLPGRLRVEPSPPGSRVLLDGREVSHGTWSGEAPSGDHVVQVDAPWHESQRIDARVSSRRPLVVRPVLRELPRVYVDVWAGLSLRANLGVPLANCALSCSGTVLAVAGGYEVTPRLGIELAALLGVLEQESVVPAVASAPTGAASTAAYREAAYLELFTGGVAVRYRLFDRTPLTLRFFLAMARGFGDLSSKGVFTGGGTAVYGSSPTRHVDFWEPFLGPDVRFGYRFDAGIAFDLGLGFYAFTTPATPASANPSLEDPTLRLPRDRAFGSLGYIVPLTAALHFEL